ncbi:MAG: putative membrane protein [Methanobacterium sp. Maddingley MBC34]|nr:MAG: putative membrane protein [Methanobacterium sp. Maddingley MBC34]
MFNKLGDIILRFFSLLGAVILIIPKIPQKLRHINRDRVKEKIETKNIKENVSKVRENLGIDEKTSKINSKEKKHLTTESSSPTTVNVPGKHHAESDVILISTPFTSKEKENTIFRLQLLSAGFLILSVLYLFNFFSIILYGILGILIGGYILYLLFNRVKVMYGSEFPAYRDFFIMYLAVGILLVLVGTNSNLVMAFSFSFFPSLTLLIFAIIAVVLVYLIFRIRYNRDFTYGVVIETGERMAYVKVEYDIRSNVKPDIYVVQNDYGALTGDTVKLNTEKKLFSNSGNKPISVMETVNKI